MGPTCVRSWRCPGVVRTESGRPLPSQARCTLGVRPPRLCPSPSSVGCWTPCFGRPDSADATRHSRAGGHGRSCCPRWPPRPPPPPPPTASARAPGCGPTSRRAASGRAGRRRSAPVQCARGGRATAPRGAASPSCHGGPRDDPATSPATLGQQRRADAPHLLSQLAASDPLLPRSVLVHNEATTSLSLRQTGPSRPPSRTWYILAGGRARRFRLVCAAGQPAVGVPGTQASQLPISAPHALGRRQDDRGNAVIPATHPRRIV
jgi:hypothetical protein